MRMGQITKFRSVAFLSYSLVFLSLLCISLVEAQAQAKSNLVVPTASVIRIDINGKPIRVLNKIPNSESVINSNDRIWLRCKAPYPVQWVYMGNGGPDFLTQTSTEKMSNMYQADLKIDKTSEKHTGKYTCRSLEVPDAFTFFYLYVPGTELFTAAKAKEVLFSPTDTTIVIPCTVSEKDAIVTLQKSVEDILQGPLPGKYEYDPKIGFRIKLADLEDPAGIYVCSAAHGNLFRLMEYTVMSKDTINRTNVKSCTPSPCGHNARCRLLGSIVTCVCLESFRGDPYHSCQKPCAQNSDCPAALFCNTTMKTCEDPCRDYYCDLSVAECKVTSHHPICVQSDQVRQAPCGSKPSCPSGTRCRNVNGQPKCICAKGFLGGDQDMGCYAECQNSMECSNSKSCEYPSCADPCSKFNPCGVNAKCLVQRHNRVCECNAGFTGEPHQMCYKMKPEGATTTTISPRPSNIATEGKVKATTAKPGPCQICGPRSSCNLVNGKITCSCKPGYLGSPPNCSPSCTMNVNCSATTTCFRGRCLNPCELNRTRSCGQNTDCEVENHVPICHCIKGHEGNPEEGCKKIPESSPDPNVDPSAFSPRCAFNFCNSNRRRPSVLRENARRLLTAVRVDQFFVQ